MLKYLAILSLFIPLAAVGVLAGQNAQIRTPEQGIAKADSSQNGSDQRKAQDGKQDAANAVPPAHQPPAPTCNEACQQARQNLKIQRELSIFTGLLVFVGFLQVGTMIWQALLLKQTREDIHTQADWMETQTDHISRQADMAERQARLISTQASQMLEQTEILRSSVAVAQKAADAADISARAAMGIAIPILRLNEFRFLPSGNQTLIADLRMPSMRISVKNYGETPAFLKSFAVEFTCEELPEVLKYPSFIHFDPAITLASGESYVMEGNDVLPWNPFSEEDAGAIASGKKTLTIYGCIWYGDVFGPTIHELKFKRWAADFGSNVIWIDPEIKYETKAN